MTTLDEIRARTKSTEYSTLRGLKVEPDPVFGINAVLLRNTADGDGMMNILGIMDDGRYQTPVMDLEDAHAVMNAARDAKTLMLIVDAIRAKLTHEAVTLRDTVERMEINVKSLPRGERSDAYDELNRYRHYSAWADSVAKKVPMIIDEILNPKEDTPNE